MSAPASEAVCGTQARRGGCRGHASRHPTRVLQLDDVGHAHRPKSNRRAPRDRREPRRRNRLHHPRGSKISTQRTSTRSPSRSTSSNVRSSHAPAANSRSSTPSATPAAPAFPGRGSAPSLAPQPRPPNSATAPSSTPPERRAHLQNGATSRLRVDLVDMPRPARPRPYCRTNAPIWDSIVRRLQATPTSSPQPLRDFQDMPAVRS